MKLNKQQQILIAGAIEQTLKSIQIRQQRTQHQAIKDIYEKQINEFRKLQSTITQGELTL